MIKPFDIKADTSKQSKHNKFLSNSQYVTEAVESSRYERPLGTRDKLALSEAEREVEETSFHLEYCVDSKDCLKMKKNET